MSAGISESSISRVMTLTFVTNAMRRMKRNAASTIPTSIATVRSTTTVRIKVVSKTTTSLFGAFRSDRNVRHSLILYATTTRIAAKAARGIIDAKCPNARRISSSVSAWTMPAIGVRPPLLIFVAVRAIAPVAGIPPKSGLAMFAMPCATSSMFERCFPPIMPSETTADSKDSTAPSTATVKIEGISIRIIGRLMCGNCGAGIAPEITPKRLPIVSTSRLKKYTTDVINTSATKGDGIFCVTRGQ